MHTHRGKLQALVGAEVGFEHFPKVSGVQAVAEARQRRDARLAARGAAPSHFDGSRMASPACSHCPSLHKNFARAQRDTAESALMPA